MEVLPCYQTSFFHPHRAVTQEAVFVARCGICRVVCRKTRGSVGIPACAVLVDEASLCYLPLHQPLWSANFLCSNFRFLDFRSLVCFLSFFSPLIFSASRFYQQFFFSPGHCSIMSCLRNKPCWNTLETYLPNDNFLFITTSGD